MVRGSEINPGMPNGNGDGKIGAMPIGAGTGELLTQLSKIEFPKFDGIMLKEWLYKCQQVFALDGTSPKAKVRLASIHPDGKSSQWHHTYMKRRCNQFSNWPEYLTDISAKFEKLFGDPIAELVSLQQNGMCRSIWTSLSPLRLG